MDHKGGYRIVGLLLVYAVFALITQTFQSAWIFQINQGKFISIVTGNFRANALMVVIVAFACSLVWFAAGEWAIEAWAPARTWLLTWAVLFLVIVAGAIYYWFRPLGIVLSDPDSYSALSSYLAIGILPFYITSVLFTPTNGRYSIWPAKHIVNW